MQTLSPSSRTWLDELGLEVPFASGPQPAAEGESGAGFVHSAEMGASPFAFAGEAEDRYGAFEPEQEGEEPDGVVFPSGLKLMKAQGPTGPGQEHYDPTHSGLPLLATPPAVHASKLSAYFTVKELVSSGGRPASLARISPELVALLDAIRVRAGKPVRIVSGYRSYLRNKQVYAARGQKPTESQHSSGKAADIAIAGMSGLQMAKLALEAGGPDLAIGVGRADVHVDVRGKPLQWSYARDPAQKAREVAAVAQYRKAVRNGGVPAPVPVPLPQPVPPQPATAGAAGELKVARHPLLKSHRGTPPDLLVLWNGIQSGGDVDVVVHFHGYSGSGPAMRIDTEKRRISGLDFTSASGVHPRPVVAILPRGHFFGGDKGNAYSFPALTRPGGLQALVADCLARVGASTGHGLRSGRLILTGHSGGGAPIVQVLAHTDPDEIHIYDGTYNPVAALVRWAKTRIARDSATPAARPPALRVIYIAGTGTQKRARQIADEICPDLAGAPRLRPLFQVDEMPKKSDHGTVARKYGGLLLNDPAAVLPGTTPVACSSGAGEAEMAGYENAEVLAEGWSEDEDESFAAPWDGAEAEAWSEDESSELSAEAEESGEALAGEDESAYAGEYEGEDEGAYAFVAEGEDEGWQGEEEAVAEAGAYEAMETSASEDAAGEAGLLQGEGEAGEDEALAWMDYEAEAEDEGEQFEDGASETALLGPDVLTLEALLESEAGPGSGLADRVKGAAELALGPDLKRGQRGAAVASLQRALGSLGHDLAVDGVFGANTQRAVRTFQSRSGLQATGVVDARTKAALAQALLGKASPVPVPTPVAPAVGTLPAAIVRVAEQEYRRWRPNGVLLTETDDAGIAILQQYYREAVGMQVTAAQLKNATFRANNPWSAVFISWVMTEAGARASFGTSPAHQTYVARAKRNRLQGNTASPFWAYRPTEAVPQTGDLVCWERGGSGATYDNIDGRTRLKTHCDVVTEVRPGELRTVGGNVSGPGWGGSGTVAAKKVRTLPDGRVALDGAQARIYAIVRCRGALQAQAPGPQPKPQAQPQPVPQPAPGSGKLLVPRDTTWPLRVRPEFLAFIQDVRFRNGSEIDAWFRARTGQSFIAWFNANHARQGWWSGKVPRRDKDTGVPLVKDGKPRMYRAIQIDGAPASVLQARFVSFWNSIPVMFTPQQEIGLVQFLSLMSIAINEVNGDLVSHPENGTLKYMFQYNRGDNRLAGDLFNDAAFNAAHGTKALAPQLMGSKDAVWRGRDWPAAVPDKPSPKGTTPSYPEEADFYKFRGRGVIQTTFRSAYKTLLRHLTARYAGSNPVLLLYRGRWSGQDPETVLTQSSNQDWDRIFDQAEVLPIAVHLHASSRSRNYLHLASDAATLNGEGPGSIYMIGRAISGSPDYGRTFAQRVIQLLDGLGNGGAGKEVLEADELEEEVN